MLGKLDGIIEGRADGASDGISVGDSVGRSLGKNDGFAVGPAVVGDDVSRKGKLPFTQKCSWLSSAHTTLDIQSLTSLMRVYTPG